MSAVICVLCADHQTHTGHLCPRCLGRLRRDLADIARLWDDLSGMLIPGSSGRSGGHGGRLDPPAPLRLDILDLLDARPIPGRDELRSEAVQHITGWTRIWCEEQRFTVPADVPGCLRLLAVHADGLAGADWIDEAAHDLRRAASLLAVAAHDTGDPPIGTCWQTLDDDTLCGGTLRIHTLWHPTDPGRDQTSVACARCRDEWTVDDLAHMGRTAPIEIWESVSRVATMLDIPARTVRHWAAAGAVRRDSLGRVLHAEVWRHAHKVSA